MKTAIENEDVVSINHSQQLFPYFPQNKTRIILFMMRVLRVLHKSSKLIFR